MSSGHDFIVGWDIGGAHLKAALLDFNGCYINSVQLACPLWRGLHELTAAMQKILQLFNLQTSHTQHTVTMTGELVDLFADRDIGVCQIAECASKLLGQNTVYYAANIGFVGLNDVERYASDVASANWHASATLIALHVKNGLLIDIGSTTTDIVPILAGKISKEATTDAARLQNDTLVYTGIVRTPVMALAQKLPFQGTMTNVMAEYFATMADVYRLTGELNPAADMAETADGKGKTPIDSARRLARMVGHDVDSSLERLDLEPFDFEPWVQLAFTCRSLQIRQIKTAINKHIQPNMHIITIGVGGFLAQAIAAEMHLPLITIGDIFSELAPENKSAVETCFPAYAVAKLMHQSIIKHSI